MKQKHTQRVYLFGEQRGNSAQKARKRMPRRNYRRHTRPQPKKMAAIESAKYYYPAQFLPNIPGCRYDMGGLRFRRSHKVLIDWSTLARMNEQEIRETVAGAFA